MRGQSMRFGRFSVIGLLGAGVQLVAFSLLVKIFELSAATALAVELAVLHNFAWHERFTWPDRVSVNLARTMARLCRFHAANGLVSILGNTALAYCFVEWLGFRALPAEIAGIALCAPLNFWCADRWVYAPAEPQP